MMTFRTYGAPSIPAPFAGEASTSRVSPGWDSAITRMTCVETIMSPSRSCRRKRSLWGRLPQSGFAPGVRIRPVKIRIHRRFQRRSRVFSTAGKVSHQRRLRSVQFRIVFPSHYPEARSVKRYFTLALLAAATAGAQDTPKPTPLTPVPKAKNQINIPYEKYTLPNGLTVILSQDKSAPTVMVNVAYHVGSKNE